MEVGKLFDNMEQFSSDTKAEKLDLRNPIDFTEPRKIDSFNPHDACNYWDDDFSEEADEEIDTRPYEELSEEEQWNIDNPDYPYEDAKLTDDLYGTNDIEEWKEYKDLKRIQIVSCLIENGRMKNLHGKKTTRMDLRMQI